MKIISRIERFIGKHVKNIYFSDVIHNILPFSKRYFNLFYIMQKTLWEAVLVLKKLLYHHVYYLNKSNN